MFLAPLPIVYIFRNLFVFRDCVLMLKTSTKETYFRLLSYFNKVLDIIKFEKQFLNSTTDTQVIVKYNIGFKTLLQQGKSETIFYCDLVYKFKTIL